MNLERTDRANWSSLKHLTVSAKHYLHFLSTPRPDTDALKMGRLMHALIFEPDKVNERYSISPRFNRSMKNETALSKGYDGGREAAGEWLASVGARDVIGAEMYATACGMALAVKQDPVAGPIVSTGWSERTIEWTDIATGIECRCRIDHLNGILADAKSTRNLVGFERDISKFGYAGQLSFYADGLAAAGIVTTGKPCIIAVENTAPFDVQVLVFDEDDLAVGRRVYRRCLDRLAECRKTGLWLGVSGGVARRVVLPPWTDPLLEDMEIIIDGHTVKL